MFYISRILYATTSGATIVYMERGAQELIRTMVYQDGWKVFNEGVTSGSDGDALSYDIDGDGKLDISEALTALSQSPNVSAASSACASIANLLSIGATLSTSTCEKFLSVVERPAPIAVCSAISAAISFSLISEFEVHIKNEFVASFLIDLLLRIVHEMRKRAVHCCETATQRYLASAFLSLSPHYDKDAEIEGGKMIKIAREIAIVAGHAKSVDGVALKLTLEATWLWMNKSRTMLAVLEKLDCVKSLMSLYMQLSSHLQPKGGQRGSPGAAKFTKITRIHCTWRVRRMFVPAHCRQSRGETEKGDSSSEASVCNFASYSGLVFYASATEGKGQKNAHELIRNHNPCIKAAFGENDPGFPSARHRGCRYFVELPV